MKYNSDIFLQQTAGLLDETDGIAALANVSALLKLYMPEANWTGFYLVKDDLTVGPFQGKPACTHSLQQRSMRAMLAGKESTAGR